MRKLKTEAFLLELHHLQTPFIMLVPKLILFVNIEVNTHHVGLAIYSLFCILHTIVLNLPNISLYPLYAKV